MELHEIFQYMKDNYEPIRDYSMIGLNALAAFGLYQLYKFKDDPLKEIQNSEQKKEQTSQIK